ncbi:MAG: hypothetical protein KDE51_05715 [Anaerolineales bacterium]|nr:hypothetical protein [Anaerolineales bacterium]
MSTRGLVSTKGELFGYLRGSQLYTLDDELTGRVDGLFIVDLSGKKIWRLVGDGLYTIDGTETIGYLSEPRPDQYDY